MQKMLALSLPIAVAILIIGILWACRGAQPVVIPVDGHVRARSITLVDDDGESRAFMKLNDDGIAVIGVHNPQRSTALFADSTGEVGLFLVNTDNSYGAKYSIDETGPRVNLMDRDGGRILLSVMPDGSATVGVCGNDPHDSMFMAATKDGKSTLSRCYQNNEIRHAAMLTDDEQITLLGAMAMAAFSETETAQPEPARPAPSPARKNPTVAAPQKDDPQRQKDVAASIGVDIDKVDALMKELQKIDFVMNVDIQNAIVYVDGETWAATEYQNKEPYTKFLAVYVTKHGSISDFGVTVKDGHSGKTLATFSMLWGFRNKE